MLKLSFLLAKAGSFKLNSKTNIGHFKIVTFKAMFKHLMGNAGIINQNKYSSYKQPLVLICCRALLFLTWFTASGLLQIAMFLF